MPRRHAVGGQDFATAIRFNGDRVTDVFTYRRLVEEHCFLQVSSKDREAVSCCATTTPAEGTTGISTRWVGAYVKKALGEGYAVMMAAGRTGT